MDPSIKFCLGNGASHSSVRLASPSSSLIKLVSARDSGLSLLTILKRYLDTLTSWSLHPSPCLHLLLLKISTPPPTTDPLKFNVSKSQIQTAKEVSRNKLKGGDPP